MEIKRSNQQCLKQKLKQINLMAVLIQMMRHHLCLQTPINSSIENKRSKYLLNFRSKKPQPRR